MYRSMFTPFLSDGSDSDGPPNRSELESRPLPDAFGGSGVGRIFGVGAEEDDLDGALISGIGGCGSLCVDCTPSMTPSRFEIGATLSNFGDGAVAKGECAGAVKIGFEGGGDCCDGIKGCCIVPCGEYDIVCVFNAVGGSIRLAIDGDADARFT